MWRNLARCDPSPENPGQNLTRCAPSPEILEKTSEDYPFAWLIVIGCCCSDKLWRGPPAAGSSATLTPCLKLRGQVFVLRHHVQNLASISSLRTCVETEAEGNVGKLKGSWKGRAERSTVTMAFNLSTVAYCFYFLYCYHETFVVVVLGGSEEPFDPYVLCGRCLRLCSHICLAATCRLALWPHALRFSPSVSFQHMRKRYEIATKTYMLT